MSKKSIIGLVRTETTASDIITELKRMGFSGDDISVLLPDRTTSRDFAHENNTKAPEGAVAGVASGGAVGGTLGLLVGIGALAIPGLGPLIAAGPLLAALSGAAVGAAVGGVAGALIGLGIPEIEAKKYEGKIRDGNVLVAVHCEDSKEIDRARDVLKLYKADDIATVGEAKAPTKTPIPGQTLDNVERRY
jgi:hypothetical protein